MMVVTEDNVDSEVIKAQQEARAKLRELFLHAMNDLQGEPCKITTYENTSLSANFGMLAPSGNDILVRDLVTPSFMKMKTALLRAPDVLFIQFERPVLLP